MISLFSRTGWMLLAILLLLPACQSKKIDNTMGVEPDGPVSFSEDVLPLFTATCGGSSCHIDQSNSGVNLSTYEQVMNSVGVQYGEPIVLPNDPANSPLIDKLEPSPRYGLRMPQDRAPLSASEIALIRAWIEEGALDN